MRYRSVLSPGAQAEISSAVRWYQRIDRNQAFRFMLEIRATLRRLERFPYQFPIVEARKYFSDPVRRAHLKHFPYSMYFRLNKDVASVKAIIHQRRNHTAWMDRGNGSY